MSLVAGRDFTWTDIYELRPVAMVSENLARELWGHPAAAIGKRIRPYAKGGWREVVGVVGDMRDDALNEKTTAVAYWPLMMEGFLPAGDTKTFVLRGATFVVRSGRTGTAGFVDDLGRAVWSINANVPLAGVRTVQEIYDRSLARTSFTLVMLAIAGGMALLLGVAGIYGVISYSVSQRAREIGIRIALGAQPQAVTRMFVAHGLTLAGIGVTLGLLAAAGVMRVISSLLFEVSPIDPLTYVLVSLTLVARHHPGQLCSGVARDGRRSHRRVQSRVTSLHRHQPLRRSPHAKGGTRRLLSLQSAYFSSLLGV